MHLPTARADCRSHTFTRPASAACIVSTGKCKCRFCEGRSCVMPLYVITDTQIRIVESSGHLYIFSCTPTLPHRRCWHEHACHPTCGSSYVHMQVQTCWEGQVLIRRRILRTGFYVNVHLCARAHLHTQPLYPCSGAHTDTHRPTCNSCPVNSWRI